MTKTKPKPATKLGSPPSALGRAAAAVARRLRDVDLAHQRIGTTTEAQCRWLLEGFVARDPATLATGELATLRDNLQALANFGGLMEAGARPKSVATLSGGSFAFDDPVLVDDAAVRQVWERVVALTRAHREPVALPAREEVLRQVVQGGPYLRLVRHARLEGLADQIVLKAARLLEGCERLRICPECDRIFVARRRQERHPECARKARDRRRPSRQKKGA